MDDVRTIIATRTGQHGGRLIEGTATYAPFAPGVEICELWHVAGPVDLNSPDLTTPAGLMLPVPGQAVARLVRFLPAGGGGSKEAENAQLAGTWDIEFNGDLHRTATVDYSIVRRGEVVLVLEEGEIVLRRGDALILLGGFHGWENRGAEPAEIFSVMLGSGPALTQTCVSKPTPDVGTGAKRVIAGHDRSGRSAVLAVTELPPAKSAGGGASVRTLWHSSEAPPESRFDGGLETDGPVSPPSDVGSSFWLVELPPMEASGGEAGLREHDTIDFLMPVDGSATYLAGDKEVRMDVGDVLIQIGNTHSWRHSPSDGGTLAVVHIGTNVPGPAHV